MNTAIPALQVNINSNETAVSSTNTIRTTCPYCGTGCGVTVEKNQSALHSLSGDDHHPTNFGKLCSKGNNLLETVDLSARLLMPEIDHQPVGWEQALTIASQRIKSIIDIYGPDAFAIYGSGQLLTEDYYVANKFMKGFIGSANIDTNSRLCMASAVVAHKRAFGTDAVPGCYEDLEQADLVVLIGSNMVWCHPILFQRIQKARENNPNQKIVSIDPRRTVTCQQSDLHLPIKPGTDAILFNGLLVYLADQKKLNNDYIQQHTDGFDDALVMARKTAPNIKTVAKLCELDIDQLTKFYQWFAKTEKTVSCFSQGINQSSSGSDKGNAIINVHLATGRIGKPGAAPFSLTGQPNAMGGREVGGLANQLAAHLEIENPAHRDLVQRFWGSEQVAQKPGLKAVDLFRAIEQGKVKAVWIMATNPVDSLPDADRVKAALAKCDLVLVSDCMSDTDTSVFANIRFPATGWGEKDGTVTNAERCISRQRAVQPASGLAKPDWWIVSQIAKRLGYQHAFDYQSPWQIFREHAQLSALENNAKQIPRDFNLSAWKNISSTEYDELQPTQWPVTEQNPQGRARLFGDGKFYTVSGKAKLLAVQPQSPVHATNDDFPLLLNTGRVRDQWHTMTRTGLSSTLSSHIPEPLVEVHPDDAVQYQLTEGEIAKIESKWGRMLARVKVTDDIKSGQVFVPIHWSQQFSSQGRVGPLINPEVDPYSGQPESKHTPVRISHYPAQWHAVIFSRTLPAIEKLPEGSDYWVRIVGKEFQRLEIASTSTEIDWQLFCRTWSSIDGQWMEYLDSARQSYRAAQFNNGRLLSVVLASPKNDLPERDWIGSLFKQSELSYEQRRLLLSGVPPKGEGAGPVVCACFAVGKNTIVNTIRDQGLTEVSEVGRCLKAGTNCGSCQTDIRQLLDDSRRVN